MRPWVAAAALVSFVLPGCMAPTTQQLTFGEALALAEPEARLWREGATLAGASSFEFPPLDIPGADQPIPTDPRRGDGRAVEWNLRFEDPADGASLRLSVHGDGRLERGDVLPGVGPADREVAVEWNVDSPRTATAAAENATFAAAVASYRKPAYTYTLYRDTHPKPLRGPPESELLGGTLWRIEVVDGRLFEVCEGDDNRPECSDDRGTLALVDAQDGAVEFVGAGDAGSEALDSFWRSLMVAPGAVWVDDRQEGTYSGPAKVTRSYQYGLPLTGMTMILELCYGREIPGSRIVYAVTLPEGERHEAETDPALGGERCIRSLLEMSAGSSAAFGTVVLEIGKPAGTPAADFSFHFFAGVVEGS